MADTLLAAVAQDVVAQYGSFTAPSEEGQQQLAAIKQNVEGWFAAPGRLIGQAARLSVSQFVAAEMDCVTPGTRGLGRTSDYVPRLGGRHRAALSILDENAADTLRQMLQHHVLCGYCYMEFYAEISRFQSLTRSRGRVPAALLVVWRHGAQDPGLPARTRGNLGGRRR